MPRVRLAGALTFISLLVACGGSTTPSPKRAESMGLKIGLLLDQLREERWQRDRDLFVSRVEELGGKVVVKSADGDPAKQLADANALLDEGVKVLVVVPTDLEKAGAIVQAAAAKKVPVVSYDRLIRDADVALYVSFDNVKVGRMQAERLVARAPTGNYVLLGGSPPSPRAWSATARWTCSSRSSPAARSTSSPNRGSKDGIRPRPGTRWPMR
jgi:D-xylose transport system substrate-binding protein